jgi:hypothetical protein
MRFRDKGPQDRWLGDPGQARRHDLDAAVAKVKRAFDVLKAAHAGIADPLASGGLSIALGEAQDGQLR